MSPQTTDQTIGLSLRQTTYLLVQGQLPAYVGHASYENATRLFERLLELSLHQRGHAQPHTGRAAEQCLVF